jgi:protein gp37
VADGSHIEWTDATWNPLVGCTKVSPGCDNCYAETLVNRFAGHSKSFPNRFDVVTMRDVRMLTQPLRWSRPRRLFVNSLSDLFHAAVPDEFIARVFAVMAAAPQHTFQLLTKRHGRMRSLLTATTPDAGWGTFGDAVEEAMAEFTHASLDVWPLPNVWIGVSVEDQHWADIRIPALLDTPAAVRWISAEPLLGPLNLDPWRNPGETPDPRTPADTRLDWVVVGGESGPRARPMHPQWARDIRDQCEAAGVAFHFKQWGQWLPLNDRPGAIDVEYVPVGKKAAGRELDGRTHDGYPGGVVRA